MFINKTDGQPAKLLAQTARSTVEFAKYEKDGTPLGAHELPSHEFFAQYREATRDEINALEALEPASTPDPKAKTTVNK